MLNVQYRMHPLLSAFPSQAFYEGKLLDAIMQTPVEKPPSWKYKHNLVVVPVFDQESPKGTSHMNEGEAEVLVKHLEDYLENGGSEESIGVKLLRRMLKSRHIKTGLQGVEVNSVDGFQGREKEVIMISTVRSNEQNTTGFVRDWRRVNAINEAKRQVAKKHREAPIVLVAPKSDERLAEKMKAAGSFLFPYAERVKLFQSLLRCNGAHDVVFDGHWRHFTGDAREIRVATDRAFETWKRLVME
eukprot:g21209.t3